MAVAKKTKKVAKKKAVKKTAKKGGVGGLDELEVQARSEAYLEILRLNKVASGKSLLMVQAKEKLKAATKEYDEAVGALRGYIEASGQELPLFEQKKRERFHEIYDKAPAGDLVAVVLEDGDPVEVKVCKDILRGRGDKVLQELKWPVDPEAIYKPVKDKNGKPKTFRELVAALCGFSIGPNYKLTEKHIKEASLRVVLEWQPTELKGPKGKAEPYKKKQRTVGDVTGAGKK